MKLFLSIALTFGIFFTLKAQGIDEATALMNSGRYAEAREMLDHLIASSKSNNQGQLNLLAGECARQLDDNDAALNYFNKAAQRGVADAYLHLGRISMTGYDFAHAREHYNKYISLKEKAGKDASAGHNALAQATLAADMLERVEKIEFIDSINLPLGRILDVIALSPQAGSFFTDEKGNAGFLSSDKRVRYTTAPLTDAEGNGYMRICEQNRLLSGNYDEPELIMDENDASYPFMMPDGCTFYFASQREGGLGGLDIYRSNRDAEDGSYMGAVNMGMPYNSPANDYLLAIDEYTGAGWLVTDRGHEADGLVSVYVFIPREVRENHDASTEDIISLARIDDIADTQIPGKDYSALLNSIDSLRQPSDKKKPEYSFTMPDGHVVTEFPDEKSRHALRQYRAAAQAEAKARGELAEMRRLYGKGRTDLADRILQTERELPGLVRATRTQRQRLIGILEP